jgi:hypothetical protein
MEYGVKELTDAMDRYKEYSDALYAKVKEFGESSQERALVEIKPCEICVTQMNDMIKAFTKKFLQAFPTLKVSPDLPEGQSLMAGQDGSHKEE